MKVVTGGKSGIGLAIVNLLKREDEIEVFDLPEIDVRSYARVQAEFKRLGKIEALINCAGIGLVKHFIDCSVADWKDQIDTNLYGVMNCCHAALPYLEGGDIINISSRSAKYDHKGLAAYCASKAGVSMFSEVLAQELQDIRVSHIMPGRVNTGFAGDPLRDWHIQPENVALAVYNILKLPRNASYGRIELLPSRNT